MPDMIKATITVVYHANGGYANVNGKMPTLEQKIHQDREGYEEGAFGLEDLIEWADDDAVQVTFEPFADTL